MAPSHDLCVDIASSRSYMALISNDRPIMRAAEHFQNQMVWYICSCSKKYFRLRLSFEASESLNRPKRPEKGRWRIECSWKHVTKGKARHCIGIVTPWAPDWGKNKYPRVVLRCNSIIKVHLNCTKYFVWFYKYLCKQIIGSGLTNKMIERNYADKSFYESCNL